MIVRPSKMVVKSRLSSTGLIHSQYLPMFSNEYTVRKFSGYNQKHSSFSTNNKSE